MTETSVTPTGRAMIGSATVAPRPLSSAAEPPARARWAPLSTMVAWKRTDAMYKQQALAMPPAPLCRYTFPGGLLLEYNPQWSAA